MFLDKSIFNKKTGWCQHAYTLIGDKARYPVDIRRGTTWSITSVMTLDGWLLCTGVKAGYWKADDFMNWLQDYLLPCLLERYRNRPMVIVLDNVSIYISQQVTEIIKGAGYLLCFLLPYLPDYNPIELTFLVIKAWIKWNWVSLCQTCGSYGDFLKLVIQESYCDCFAR